MTDRGQGEKVTCGGSRRKKESKEMCITKKAEDNEFRHKLFTQTSQALFPYVQ